MRTQESFTVPARRLAYLVGFLALAMAGPSCPGDQPFNIPVPITLRVVSGDAQPGLAGRELTQPLVVQVLQSGSAVRGQIVNFVVTDGGGSVFAPAAITNDTGYVQQRWTLGTVPGALQRLEARAVDAGTGEPLTFAVFTATANPPQLGFTVQPRTTAVRAPISPAVEVTARDAQGDTAKQFTGPVTITIGTNPGGGTLSGTTTIAAVAGVARFADLSLSSLGQGYTLTATVAGPTSTTSAPFDITPGPAATLAFTVQPSTATAGVPIAPAVEVAARDAFGNIATSFTDTVTMTLGTNPSGGALTGTLKARAVAGVATFANLAIDRAGVGYTLVANSGSVASGTSSPFTITPALAATIARNAGDNQTVTVNTPVLTPPSVIIRDQFNNPVGGIPVTFAVGSGTGSLTGASQTTNAAGIATVGNWTVGTTAGPYTLTATSPGLSGNPVTFTALAVAGAASAAQSTVSATSPIGASTGATPATITVTVRDALGNPISGATVLLSTTGTGNTLTQPVAATDSSGVATGTLSSTVAEVKTVSAAVNGTAVTQTATVTVTPAAAATIARNAGDSQTVTVNTPIPIAPSVIVRDQFNNPVAGVPVIFAALGGALTGANQTTTAAGIATVGSWTLGTTAGTNTLTATAPGLTGNPVTFTATGTPGAAQITDTLGDGQTATVGTRVLINPAVFVRDQFNNPVAGVPVTFAVASGGGSITDSVQTTASNGIATLGSWTLGPIAGSNTLSATAPGVTGSPVIFTATGNPGTVAQIALAAGDNATATVNTAVANAPSVIVRDQFNNPVAGVTVTFTVATGDGSVIGPNQVASNAAGVATVGGWILGRMAGPNTLTATGPAGSPVTFRATGTPDVAAQVAFNAGGPQPQATTVNTAVPTPPSVIVRDQFGNPVAGFVVTFAVAPGNGSVTSGTQTSNTAGIATVGSWTLGGIAGMNTLIATAPGLVGSPVTFMAIGTAGTVSASRSTLTASSPITAGGPASTISVTARDAFGNSIPSVTVALAATGSENILTFAPLTNANGVATGTLTSTVAESKIVSAVLDGTAVSETTTILVNPGLVSASQSTVSATSPITASSGGSQSTITVTARDAFGNRISNATVILGATGTGNGVTQPASATNGTGVATGALSSTVAELKTISATINGTAAAQTATVTVTPAAAATIARSAGDSQTVTVTMPVPVAPSVIVRDQFNNPVAGVAVTFAVAPGSGAVTGATQTTTAAGIATVGSWTLGTAAGPHTLTAASPGLTGSPVTFTAMGVAGSVSATQSTVSATSPISASTGATQATITVTARDALGNPISGATVVLAATGTGNTLIQPAPTNAIGVATGTLSSTAAEVKTVSATISGTSVTQTATVTVTPALAATIARNAGDSQTVAVSTPVPIAPSVIVRDQFNNPVAGVAVTFAPASGGGNVTGPEQTTNAAGIAQVGSWILGTAAGPNTLTATSTGLSGSPVTFIATGTPGPVSATQSTVSATSPISASTGATPATITVTARDALGNLISGASVVLSATGIGNALTQPLTPTNASGVATGTLSSTAAEVKTVSATINGTAVTQTATVTVTPAAAATIARNAGDSQTVTVNTPVPVAPSVIVRDQFNNPVAGVLVTFAVGLGDGSVTGASQTTTAAGIATAGSWRLGTIAGQHTLNATSSGLTGSPVTFTATGTAGLVSGSQSTLAATSPMIAGGTPSTVTVTARDPFGNPVAGVTVVLAATGTGNTLTQPAGTTNASGVATGSLASSVAESKIVSATVNGAAVTQTATIVVNAGAASQLSLTTPPSSTAQSGVAFAQQPVLRLRDAFGNAVGQSGVAVTATIASGGGTLGGTPTVTTDAGGVASFTDLAITGTVGNRTLSFGASGLPSVTSTITITAGPATQIAANSPTSQVATVNSPVPTPPSVIVRDQAGNPVAGVAVTFAVSGTGSVTGPNQMTNALGVATVASWTLGTAAGPNTLTATAPGLTGSPVTFTATGTAGPVSPTQSTLTATSPITAGGTGSSITVTARDAFGNPIQGASVVLVATGSANTLTFSQLTDAAGVATGTLTSTAADTKTLSATLNGTAVTQTASVVVSPGAVSAAQSSLDATSPVAAGGTSVITVTARDVFGNRISGATVALAATGSGNTLTQPAGLTNASGVATGTLVSTVPASKVVSATINSVGVTQTATVMVTAGPAASIAPMAGAGGQTATVNTAVPTAPSVIVRDQFNNPVAGVAVTFAPASGGGSVTGPNQTTNAAGIATVGSWILGNVAGPNTLTATSPGLSGSPVTFNATGQAAGVSPAISTVTATSPITAGGAGSTVTVTARDAFGNPISGATVVLAATGTGNTLTQPLGTTDANGVATGALSSTVAEPKTVSATINGVAISQTASVAVTPAAVSAALSTVSATSPITASSGTSQSTISVTARDAFNNPISGATVVLAATGTGNTLTQPTGTTNAGGAATGTLSSTVAAGKTVSATINSVAITQTATVTVSAAAAATLVLNAGDGQPVTVNTPVPIAPSVIVRDQFGNPVPGVAVTFAPASGGGSVTAPDQITNGAGIATVGGWTLGPIAGTNTLTATSAGLAGSPVTFTATGNPGAAGQLTITTPPSASAQSGVPLAQQPVIQLRDVMGNAVSQPGVVITAAVASGPAGTVSGTTTATTNAAGLATFANLAISGSVGSYTLDFSGTDLAGVRSGTIALSAGPASQITRFGPDGQIATVNTAVGTPPSVIVRDAFNNPVGGVAVTFAPGSGSGSVTGAEQTTNAAGIATVGSWTLSTVAGPNTLTATSTGLTGSPVSFTATGVAAGVSPTISTVTATSPITAGGASSTITVTARDAFSNPISGATVVLAALGAGNTLTQPLGTTNAGGVATGTLSSTVAEAKTVSATINTIAIAQTAAVTVTPGAPSAALSTVSASPGTITASVGASQSTITVTVRDGFGNPVSGASVTLAATGTGNTITQPVGTTGAGGQSTGTLSSTRAEAKIVTASVNGTPVTQTASVTVQPAAASQLVFTVQPSSSTAGLPITPAVRVTAQDALGNAATAFAENITVAIGNNPSGATLTGTTTVAPVGGVATFSDLAIILPGTGFTLTASATGLPTVTSAAFDLIGNFALRFFGNGTNDIDRVKIQIDDPANSNPGPPADVGATDFTIEFWMRALPLENLSAAVTCGANDNWIQGNIIIDRDRHSQDRKFGISLAGGRLVFGVTGAGTGALTICGATQVANDAWHHVAVTRDLETGALQLFVDGALDASSLSGPLGDISYPDDGIPLNNCGGPCTNSDPYLVIGAEKHDVDLAFPSFRGWFDELRISTVIRYTGAFLIPSERFAGDANTAALYHFDEGLGDLIGDSSGAAGGPSNGVRRFGGNPAGPLWVPSGASTGILSLASREGGNR